MYRVELKGPLWDLPNRPGLVPNVPCGVESLSVKGDTYPLGGVPNVPCGVESSCEDAVFGLVAEFLMYRVELKAFFQHRLRGFVVRS